ncbi:hypothetical protein QUA82_06640 [Microcoleus sp. F8-D3]
MKSRILVLAALVASLGLALPSKATSINEQSVETKLLAQSSWVSIKPGEYFQFEMPGTPKDSAPGQRRVTQRRFEWKDSNSLFRVTYIDYGVGSIPENNFAREVSNILQSLNKTYLLDRGQNMPLDGYPGREFREASPKGVFVLRLYAKTNVLYILRAESSEENANRFVNSFKFCMWSHCGNVP